ncbi:tetratricopeptide repeat protein [Sphingobacterium athyrii]|uniref:tetratricopeptide repeat protein n=1 Tax=Sphingobacterium athyrii TaxID=2152717 RepID=UPI0028A95DF4|nr:tetratricopeptide repeat protein [Sphingobacterium athyrii]
MENTFISRDDFTAGFGREMTLANDVFENMQRDGVSDNCLVEMDFTFISDQKVNLLELGNFIRKHHPYTVGEIEEIDDLWEINGKTNEIPLTKDNLMYWALDMYKRGYEFDASLDAYGGLTNRFDQKFPDTKSENANDYFNDGVECYNSGNLSGAIFNWSLVILIEGDNPDAYYSRAIVKNELYTWKAALRDYDKALEIAPDFANALINRGSLKDENGDYQGAIRDYQTVIALEYCETEDLQQAYFNLGNTRLNLDDKKGACENWKKASQLGADYAQKRIDHYCL